MNAYIKIAIALALLISAFLFGDHYGTNNQKVEDQVEFDRIEKERTDQKDAASILYKKLADELLLAQAANQKLISDGVTQRENNRKATDALVAKYSGVGLRYGTQSSRLGERCSGTQSADSQASPAGATVVQLPDTLAGKLRRIVADADYWLDEYRSCFKWVTEMKCP
jgi:hypothetical protein